MARQQANPKPKSPPAKRAVDLHREEELVTWNEWFARSMDVMRRAVPESHHNRLAFRVTLVDGRPFAVKQVLAHVARGRCTIGPSRWNETEAICDVITGYVFLGAGEDELPAAMCVSPATIASVECVLFPEEEDETPRTPFGFYKREGIDTPTQRREVEETLAEGPP